MLTRKTIAVLAALAVILTLALVGCPGGSVSDEHRNGARA